MILCNMIRQIQYDLSTYEELKLTKPTSHLPLARIYLTYEELKPSSRDNPAPD